MKVDVEFNTIDCLESVYRESLRVRSTGGLYLPPQMLSLEVEATHLVVPFYERTVDLGYKWYKATRQFLYSPGPCEQGAYASVILGCGSGPFGEAAVDYMNGPIWRSIDELLIDTSFRQE